MNHTQELYSYRFNQHFILNDFMYSDSIVRRGIENVFNWDTVLLEHGQQLAELLAGIADEYGPVSVGYGYISPDVSEKIVRWQNPRQPSYHRWDKGAAADITVHGHFQRNRNLKYTDTAKSAPIQLAARIADRYEFSRMITYSESPSICIAANAYESNSGQHRRAFYENRYQGLAGKKPKFITHKETIKGSALEALNADLSQHGWVGAGYPTYHLKKKPQYQHTLVGNYLTTLDCLRCPQRVTTGIPNRVPMRKKEREGFFRVAKAMGKFVDAVRSITDTDSLSVVSGHNATYTDPLLAEFLHNMEYITPDWGNSEGHMLFSATPGLSKKLRQSKELAKATRRGWYEMGDYLVQFRDLDEYYGDATSLIHVTWRA